MWTKISVGPFDVLDARVKLFSRFLRFAIIVKDIDYRVFVI